jgi:hypothetical protein
MKFQIQEIDDDKLMEIDCKVETNSQQLDEIVKSIITPYCKDLDKYVLFIKDCLKDGENPPTTQELEDFCMNLSTYIYFASGMTEYLGIRDDIAKAVYKEMYNEHRNALTKGTVADKNSLAELASQEEAIISAAYTRSYKIMKAKIENSQELLSSCKKVLSHRMQEEELTRIGGA